MAKHTPGPWVRSSYYVVNMQEEYLVAACRPEDGLGYSKRRQEEECVANARLIAAAPELFEAVRAIVDLIDSKGSAEDADVPLSPCEFTSVAVMLDYVIRKATGEE